MDGSHRTRSTGQPRRRSGVHGQPVGARHVARTSAGLTTHPGPTAGPSISIGPTRRTASRRVERRSVARERMLQRRRRSLGALSFLVLVVTVAITLTRPSPQRAEAATATPTPAAAVGVYTQSAASDVPAGAAANGVAAAELTAPAEGTAQPVKPRTWTQPAGATIHCPITATGCVDLKAKITWLQHGTTIFLGPVRMQPGEGNKKTPRGTFTIDKKAAVYFSHTYGGAMPYSVFWGHDGIAYHEGTLTGFSHGCIHLSMANAKKFFAALRLGERVYVA
jgi:hypothetical protein